jgi:hypothetical protein
MMVRAGSPWGGRSGCALAALAAGAVMAEVQEGAPGVAPDGVAGQGADKSGYNLFHPTPRALMRELSADRPDKTDSPFTVDAGHFQVEMDFANLSYDRHPSAPGVAKVISVEGAPMNLKVGALNNLDVQLVLTPYRWERAEAGPSGAVERKSGFGDLTPRLKLNVVGNDGGPFALALLPFVKLPTAQDHLGNGSVEGGLKVPYAFAVPGWDVGFQTEIDIKRDGVGRGYHPEFVNSVSVGHKLFGRVSYCVEFYSSVSTEGGSGWVGTVDTWLTYRVSANIRLDAGVYIGVTRPAEDWHPFVGMTWRF